MNRFTKFVLIAAIALGCFAMFSADSAEAGWFHGGGCYRPCYSNSYSSASTCYRPTYSCYSSYVAPAIYRPTWSSSCYTGPSSCYGGGYWGGYGGNYCGYGGYQPQTNYGCYSGIANGYAVPVNYGYCGW